MTAPADTPPASSAVLSPCGTYRYRLERRPWPPSGAGTVVFCMLNPSTADDRDDDPTIRRLRGFAAAWGYAGFTVVNLYALRSPDPAALKSHVDPIGPLNDHWIAATATEAGAVVCAWGTNAQPERVAAVVQALEAAGVQMQCLGTTKDGHPRHPLYVKGDTTLIPWLPNVATR